MSLRYREQSPRQKYKYSVTTLARCVMMVTLVRSCGRELTALGVVVQRIIRDQAGLKLSVSRVSTYTQGHKQHPIRLTPPHTSTHRVANLGASRSCSCCYSCPALSPCLHSPPLWLTSSPQSTPPPTRHQVLPTPSLTCPPPCCVFPLPLVWQLAKQQGSLSNIQDQRVQV